MPNVWTKKYLTSRLYPYHERTRVFLLVFRSHLREKGLKWLASRVIKRIGLLLLWLLLLPLTLVGHIKGFRKLDIRVEHIGHLAAEPDTFLKETALGLMPRKRCFILAPKTKVSNHHLLGYWRQYFIIVTSPWQCWLLDLAAKHYFMKLDVSRYVSSYFGTQDIYPINSLWGQRPPFLKLSAEDEDWGAKRFKELGIPKDAWFVAIHVREGGFLPANELIQSHRNASVKNAIPALREIVGRGGICVRMGDKTMAPLPEMEGVIDYAHHPLKSDRLDVVLCAKARFFLGCTSGLALLSSIFGVPVAYANMIPVETLGTRYCDISIPKLVWSKNQQRYLRFREMFASGISGFFFSHQYEKAGLIAEENSPDDILDLIKEMLDRLDHIFKEEPEDSELHADYMKLFKEGHYSYRACSRVGISFLRRHKSLIFASEEG